MSGVSATYMDILAYVWRLSNIFNLQLAYYYGSHTQSTLVIRRIRCSYADIWWHLLTFVDIPGPKRSSYATHRFNTVSIRYVHAQFSIFVGFFVRMKIIYECSFATLTFLSYATVWQGHNTRLINTLDGKSPYSHDVSFEHLRSSI